MRLNGHKHIKECESKQGKMHFSHTKHEVKCNFTPVS